MLRAEQPLELAADPAVPVDQRSVAVEGRPAVHRLRRYMADSVTHHRWDDIPREELNPLIGRRFINGDGDDDRARVPRKRRSRAAALASQRAAHVPPRRADALLVRRRRERRFWTSAQARCSASRRTCRTRRKRSRTRWTSTSSTRHARTGSTGATPTYAAGLKASSSGPCSCSQSRCSRQPGRRVSTSFQKRRE